MQEMVAEAESEEWECNNRSGHAIVAPWPPHWCSRWGAYMPWWIVGGWCLLVAMCLNWVV